MTALGNDEEERTAGGAGSKPLPLRSGVAHGTQQSISPLVPGSLLPGSLIPAGLAATPQAATTAALRPVGASVHSFSRDEMNLAEFPLTVLSTRVDQNVKTLEFTDHVRLKNGELAERKWIITGADKFGLPTSTDDDVILGLIRLSMEHGFRQRKVYFSRYELLKALRWSTEGRSYSRLTKSLDRLSGVRIRAANSFYDNSSKSYQTCNFGIIDAYEINDHRGKKGDDAPKSFFIWSEMLFDSFKSGFIKKLDLDLYFALKSSVSRRLYRYLDKNFYFRSVIEKPLMELAFEKIGLSRTYKYVSSVKQQIDPAAEELVRLGFLASFEYVGKGPQTLVRFVSGQTTGQPIMTPGRSIPPQTAPHARVVAGRENGDRAVIDRIGIDRRLIERSGTERSGTERGGVDRTGNDRYGPQERTAFHAGGERAVERKAARAGDLLGQRVSNDSRIFDKSGFSENAGSHDPAASGHYRQQGAPIGSARNGSRGAAERPSYEAAPVWPGGEEPDLLSHAATPVGVGGPAGRVEIAASELVEALVSRGIGVKQAIRLIERRMPDEYRAIDRIIRYYDSLVETNDPKISKNKVGFLYRAVESPHRFTVPSNFLQQEESNGTPRPNPGNAARGRVPRRDPMEAQAKAADEERLTQAYRSFSDQALADGLERLDAHVVPQLVSSVEKKLSMLREFLSEQRFRDAVEGCVRDELLKLLKVPDYASWCRQSDANRIVPTKP